MASVEMLQPERHVEEFLILSRTRTLTLGRQLPLNFDGEDLVDNYRLRPENGERQDLSHNNRYFP